ncbi:MAG: FKBP-type peptidyl-prolyl cis-trans isomerase [Proteobacteria bacterium]|nr:FKBP-type peptidyl-prolyl cis-trans isomerase [Pseudomonadota bacterium]
MGLRTFLKGLSGGGGELEIEDLVVGEGEEARPGMKVEVHYVGTLTDGTKFDASRDRAQPFVFPLGGGRVIEGWDEGVVGMKVGGTRRLTVPARLGYGRRGAPPSIPGGATLVFEIELLRIKRGNASGMPC